MIKKFLAILVILLIGACGYLFLHFKDKKTLITPYPYAFTRSWEESFVTKRAEEIKAAQNAKILIMGDRMARSLVPYEKTLQETFGDSLKNPPSIYNWAEENEGLFRTLFKLKTLSRLPPIIIYFGASSELFERRFDVSDKKKILANFKQYDDEEIISLIITFPWLSRYFYKKMNYVEVGNPVPYTNHLPSTQKLEEKELGFKLFEYELHELASFVKDRKSHLVFITTPINLEVEPKEICTHATNPDLIGLQQEINSKLKEGLHKEVYPQVMELASETYGNAMTYYLLGKSALGLGELKTARDALLKASVYDCANWRGNAVYNAIIRKEAKKNLFNVVDFEQSMNAGLSSEGLFLDAIYPQGLFYQNMIKELGDILKKVLSVNE